jgi:hypothetical protein
MFNPGRIFEALERHGFFEPAILHLQSGDVPLNVGVKQSVTPAFGQFSSTDISLELSGERAVDVDTRISFRGELYSVIRPPSSDGHFTTLDLQKVLL